MDKEESCLQKWGLIAGTIIRLAKIGAWVYCIKIIFEHLVLLAKTPTSLEIIMTSINKFEISTKISVGANIILFLSLTLACVIIRYLKNDNKWLKKQIDQKEE